MNAFHNMSVPNRVNIAVSQVSVGGRQSCFNLSWACWAAGLLGAVRSAERLELLALCNAPAERKWAGKQEDFLKDLEQFCHGKVATPVPTSFLIGIRSSSHQRLLEKDMGICPDPGMTVYVMSRLAGSLYIPGRTPCLDWKELFGECFMVDDPALRFPTHKEPPWDRLLGASI